MNKIKITILTVCIILLIAWGFSFIKKDKSNLDKGVTDMGSNMLSNIVGEEEMVNSDQIRDDEKNINSIVNATGTYEVYSPDKIKLANNKAVLFFKATWCPTCRALDSNIKLNLNNIPAGITILDVDYDKYKDLRSEYGVTYQHTLVQVDVNGKIITKWSGSPTLSDLINHIK